MQTNSTQVQDVISSLDNAYPPSLAAPWDNVGLQVGDPNTRVEKIMVALDPSEIVVNEAVREGVQMLITHHPLVLAGINRFTTETSVGRVINTLNAHGISLFAAHTNADIAAGGVNDVLAELLGLEEVVPLLPIAALGETASSNDRSTMLKVVVFVPPDSTDSMIDAMARAGAGQIGNYDRCAYQVRGQGTFRPNVDAEPFVGSAGEIETTTEDRVEMVLPVEMKEQVIQALRKTHPYEEPAFDVIELVDVGKVGLGRKGNLRHPMTLLEFAEMVALVTPKTHHGVRVAGDLNSSIKTVGLVSGSGSGFLPQLKSDEIDVFLTADSKHHGTLDNLMAKGPNLVDISHWASESPWCQSVADALTQEFSQKAIPCKVLVSSVMGDPWSAHLTRQQ